MLPSTLENHKIQHYATEEEQRSCGLSQFPPTLPPEHSKLFEGGGTHSLQGQVAQPSSLSEHMGGGEVCFKMI